MPAERWGRRPDRLAARGAAAARRAHTSALRRQGRGQRPPAAVFPGHRSRGLPGRSWDRPAIAPRIAAAQGQQRFPHGEPGQGRVRTGSGEGASGSPGVPSGGTERSWALPGAAWCWSNVRWISAGSDEMCMLVVGWDPVIAHIAFFLPSSLPSFPSGWFCVSFSETNSVFHTRIEEMFW